MILPLEILDLVWDHQRPKELLEWICVSRVINAEATPKLYYTLHVYNCQVMARVVGRLKQQPSLGEIVRRVIFYVDTFHKMDFRERNALLTSLQQLTPFVEYCDYPHGYQAMTSMDMWPNYQKQWPNLKHLPSTSPSEVWLNHLPYDKWHRLESLTCVVSDLAARQRSLVAGLPGLKSIVVLYRPDREPEWTLHRVLDLCHALAPALTEVTVRVDPASIHDECHLIRGRVDIDKQIDSMATIQPAHSVRSLTLDLFDLDDQSCNYLTARYPSVMVVTLRVLHKNKVFSRPGRVEFMQINGWPCLKKLDLDLSPFLIELDKSIMYRIVGFSFNSLPRPRGFTGRFQDDQIVDYAITVVNWDETVCGLGLCGYYRDNQQVRLHQACRCHVANNGNFPNLRRLRLEFFGVNEDGPVQTLGRRGMYAVLAKYPRITCLDVVNVYLPQQYDMNDYKLSLPPASECHNHLRRLNFCSVTFESVAVLQDLLNRCPRVVDLGLQHTIIMATRIPVIIDTPERDYDLLNTFNCKVVRRNNGFISDKKQYMRIELALPGTLRNIRSCHDLYGRFFVQDLCELHYPTQADIDKAKKKKEKKRISFFGLFKKGHGRKKEEPKVNKGSSVEQNILKAAIEPDNEYFALRCRSVGRRAYTNVYELYHPSLYWDFDVVHSEQ